MRKTEALQIVKNELGEKAYDRRTKLNKALTLLEDWAKWDEAKIEGIIDETIEEFESRENDFLEAEDERKRIPATDPKAD